MSVLICVFIPGMKCLPQQLIGNPALVFCRAVFKVFCNVGN